MLITFDFHFRFSIADHADRFYVEQHGDYCMVKIQNGLDGQTLDRETSDQYTVKVLAIDKGTVIMITLVYFSTCS